MKKTMIVLLTLVMLLGLMPAAVPVSASQTTYYVSPNGSDANPGTQEQPWATLYKAAQTLTAGDTAIFEDGTYHETQYTEFANAGTAANPITVKAKNKHQAVIMYDASLRLQKLRVLHSYINVRDFAITQEVASTSESERPTLDILLNCGVGKETVTEGCEITGNRFYNVYEEGIKVKYARNVLIKDNVIENPAHEGMDIFACDSVTICGNQVINCGRTGYMIKGNSRNCLIYNNMAKNDTASCNQGYTIGGQSDSTSPYVVAENVGYEAYHCVFYNNIAHSVTGGLIESGFSFSGAKDCRAYNNISAGATNGFTFTSAPDKSNGWPWNPITVRPVLKNNIVVNANKAYRFQNVPEGLESDYNLFYQITDYESVPTESNSAYDDPKFTDASAGDFTLSFTSPARRAGTALPAAVAGYPGIDGVDQTDENKVVPIALVDYSGAERQTPWDKGVYNRGNDIDLSEDFEAYGEAGQTIGAPWTYQSYGVDKSIQSWIEPEREPRNTAVRFTAQTLEEAGLDTDCSRVLYLLKYNFGKSLFDGYLKVQYRLRSNSATSARFNMLLGNATIAADFQEQTVYGGKNAVLEEGKWYEFEYYVDVANNQISMNCDGIRAVTLAAAPVNGLNSLRFGFHRTRCGGNADVVLDDVSIGLIDEAEYNRELGLVSEKALFSEGFDGAPIGRVVKDWNRFTSSYETKNNSTNTFAQDPANPDNTVLNFESKRQKISAWNKVYYRLIDTLTDGRYSYSFQLRATNPNSGEFWVSFVDDAGKTSYIIIDFPDRQIRVQEWYLKSDQTLSTTTRSMSIPLEYNKWHTFEFIIDLTDAAQQGRGRVSISFDGNAVVNPNSATGDFGLGTTGTYSNNGTLQEVGMAIATGATATTLLPATVAGGTGLEGTDVFANFMADNLVLRPLATE